MKHDIRNFENVFWKEIWPSSSEEIAKFIILEAQKKVPIDTGQLKESLDYNLSEKKVTIGTNVLHGKIMEYGAPPGILSPSVEDIKSWAERKGVKITPFKIVKKLREKGIEAGSINAPFVTKDNKWRPWLRPALFKNQDKVIEIIFNNIKKI